jgi:bleomycin hydrolase
MKRICPALPAFLALSFALTLSACAPAEKIAPGSKEAAAPASDEAVYVTEKGAGGEHRRLTMDVFGVARPRGLEEFATLPHLPPIQQYKTGMCWCFGTVSLLESELKRLGRPEVKLSEEFTVYWEYVEKARRFVREKGDSYLAEGSQPGSAIARMKQYGVVRLSDYTGLLDGRTEHDHTALFDEFRTYLAGLKEKNAWDETKALAGVRAILDKHLGKPPDRITVSGKALKPQEFLGTLGLDLDDYVCLLSFQSFPFYTKGEYDVPDNWWHDANYYNVPLGEFAAAVPAALKKGYSVVFAADIGEPGNRGDANIGIVPTFDIPRPAIDQSSRELRFVNGSTTDDHVVHCVGLNETGPDTWFLIKDSWKTAYLGPVKGYFFYRDDYLKLKVLMIMTHKDAVEDLLAKFSRAN